MKRFLTALLCCAVLTTSAQKQKGAKPAPPPVSNAAALARSGNFNTTIFYNKDMREVKEKGSAYYLLLNLGDDNLPRGKARLLRTRDDAPVWEGEYFLFNKLEPEKSRYQGLCTWYYDNGKKWRESNFRNGVAEGKTTLYNEEGQPQYAGSFKGGKANGLMTYYDNGAAAGRAYVQLFDAVWDEAWMEKSADGEVLVDEGIMYVTAKAKDGYIKKEPLPIDGSRDFTIDLQFRFKGPEVMILYGHKDTANYYGITVSGKGFIRPENVNGGVDRSNGQTFKVQFNKEGNLLRLMRVGDDLFLSMNGNMVTSLKYTKLYGNGFGFYLPGKSSQLQVQSLVVREPGKMGKTVAADDEEKPAAKKSSTAGKWQPAATAVFVSPTLLATALSAVKDKESIGIVQWRNGVRTVVGAKLLAQDEASDMALLQPDDAKFVAPAALPYTLSNNDVETGEAIYTIGHPLVNPLADDFKVAEGVISASTGPEGAENSYRISTAVSRLNNGGPVFSKSGVLLGVASLSISEQGSGGYAAKTFAVLNLMESVEGAKGAAGQSLKGKPLKEQLRLLRGFVVEVCVK